MTLLHITNSGETKTLEQALFCDSAWGNGSEVGQKRILDKQVEMFLTTRIYVPYLVYGPRNSLELLIHRTSGGFSEIQDENMRATTTGRTRIQKPLIHELVKRIFWKLCNLCFWKLYNMCEDYALCYFEICPTADRETLAGPITALLLYHGVVGRMGLQEEKPKIEKQMCRLVRRQLGIIKTHYMVWCDDCVDVNTEIKVSGSNLTWKKLSPRDWERIFESVFFFSRGISIFLADHE